MYTFLKNLQCPRSQITGNPVPEMSEEITLEDYKMIFNKTREATSSHPPIHYGHYKMACEFSFGIIAL